MTCPECGNPLQRDPESNKEVLPCARPGCVCGHKGRVMYMPRFTTAHAVGYYEHADRYGLTLVEWHRVEIVTKKDEPRAWAWMQRQ